MSPTADLVGMRECARQLVQVALNAVPNEACGVIYHDWSWKEMRNASEMPQQHFKFDDEELVAEFGHGWEHVLGIWHSHPRGTVGPSPTDAEFPYTDLRYFIVTPHDMYEWEIRDGGTRPVDPLTGKAGAPQLAYPVLAGAVQH